MPLSQNKSLYFLGLEREIVMQNYGTLCHQIKSQVSGLSCHRIVLNWQISSFRGFRKIRPIPKYRGTFFSRFCNGRKINIPLFLLLLSRILREMKYAQSSRFSCIVPRISVAGRFRDLQLGIFAEKTTQHSATNCFSLSVRHRIPRTIFVSLSS